MQSNQASAYTFTSAPQALARTKKLFREPGEIQEEIATTSNIMWDARVRRGNGHAIPVIDHGVKNIAAGGIAQMSSREIKRANAQRKAKLVKVGAIRPTFQSVKSMHENVTVSKIREEVPIHLYLTEQTEAIVTNTESCQTDSFVQEKEEVEPQRYIPRKIGVDMGTQVDHDIVFSFEDELKPVLEVVISKTLQQSLLEVREEEELEFMRKRHVEMENKATSLTAQQKERVRLERIEFERMNARLKSKHEAKNAQDTLKERNAAISFSHGYLRRLELDVIDHLSTMNFFPDPIIVAVENFLPTVYSDVHSNLKQHAATREAVEQLLSSSLSMLHTEQQQAKEAHNKAIQQRLADEQRLKNYFEQRGIRKMKLLLYIHSNELDISPLGPIQLRGDNTIGDVQEKVTNILAQRHAKALAASDEEEDPRNAVPTDDRLHFMWNNQKLDKASVLCQLGVSNLSSLHMVITPLPDIPEPEPEPQVEAEVEETEGNEEDESFTNESFTDETDETATDNTEEETDSY